MDDCPLSLPELWPIIISSVERDPDLASVALVCRLWERIVRPRLVPVKFLPRRVVMSLNWPSNK